MISGVHTVQCHSFTESVIIKLVNSRSLCKGNGWAHYWTSLFQRNFCSTWSHACSQRYQMIVSMRPAHTFIWMWVDMGSKFMWPAFLYVQKAKYLRADKHWSFLTFTVVIYNTNSYPTTRSKNICINAIFAHLIIIIMITSVPLNSTVT